MYVESVCTYYTCFSVYIYIYHTCILFHDRDMYKGIAVQHRINKSYFHASLHETWNSSVPCHSVSTTFEWIVWIRVHFIGRSSECRRLLFNNFSLRCTCRFWGHMVLIHVLSIVHCDWCVCLTYWPQMALLRQKLLSESSAFGRLQSILAAEDFESLHYVCNVWIYVAESTA